MSKLEMLVEELKTLPPHKLAEAERIIRALRGAETSIGHEALAATAGTLSKAEADEWERIIIEDCRQIDPRDARSW